MRLTPLPGRILNALKDTVSLQGRDGHTYEISKSVTKSLPSGVELVVAMCDNGKYSEILSEKTFSEYLECKGLLSTWWREKKISSQMWYRTKVVYWHHYNKELKNAARINYRHALKGNRHGKKAYPSVLLEEGVLRDLLDRGLGVWRIAKKMSTSAFLVRQNMKHYGIEERIGKGKGCPRFAHLPQSFVLMLEELQPGILQLARAFFNNKEAFFNALYEVYLKVLDLKYAVKELGKAHNYYVTIGAIPRNHICWTDNRYEALLSAELLRRGIPHIRHRPINLQGYGRHQEKCYPDFIIDRLVVEVDGSVHKAQTVMKKDREKERLLTLKGYQIIRFTVKEVLENVASCADRIISLQQKE